MFYVLQSAVTLRYSDILFCSETGNYDWTFCELYEINIFIKLFCFIYFIVYTSYTVQFNSFIY